MNLVSFLIEIKHCAVSPIKIHKKNQYFFESAGIGNKKDKF